MQQNKTKAKHSTLLQELLKMKLSSGILPYIGMKKPPVGAGTFSPCIYWYFTFLHAGNIFRSLEQTFSVLLQENSGRASN
jgi:hypothetical protein